LKSPPSGGAAERPAARVQARRDIHDERLTTKLRAAVRAPGGILLSGAAAGAGAAARSGLVEEHRHEPEGTAVEAHPSSASVNRVGSGGTDVHARVPGRDHPVIRQVAEPVLAFLVGSILIS
jgi:hypothetical protein